MKYEDIIEKANNMFPEDIENTYTLLREGLRHYFSRFVMGHTEDKPYELDIDIEGTFGLAEREKIKYLSCFEDNEGIIWFKVGDIYEEYIQTLEIDDMNTDELIYVLKELEIKKIN